MVRRADRGPGRAAPRDRRRPGARRRPAAPRQACGPLRPADRPGAPRAGGGGRGPGAAPPARGAAGVQDRRHLRRRVPGPHAVPLLGLRVRPDDRVRGLPADRAAQGHHPGLRAQPDRPGHRVRLLLRARGLLAARRGVRDRDAQLQPRDGLHRLRHGRPPVLRAAHRGGRPRGRPRRAALRRRRQRPAPRRDPHTRPRRGRGAARRADPAQARRGARGGRGPDRRHAARGDRPRRGARRVRQGPRRRRAARPALRHGDQLRRRPRDRRGHRLPGAGPALLRARRARAWRSSTTTTPSATTSPAPPR